MSMLPGFLPRIALLVIGDGRDELRRATVESFQANALDYDLVTVLNVDDRHHLLGFCGAIRYGWARIRESEDRFDLIFHLEEDWLFDRAFSIAQMALVLERRPEIAQVALKRGPANDDEARAGGVVELHPEAFQECALDPELCQVRYLEHRQFFTTNPSVYRRSLVDAYEYPEAPECEGKFACTLRAEGATFAYWGARVSEPWIIHTGQRTGFGY